MLSGRRANQLSWRLAAIAILPVIGLLLFGGITLSNRLDRAQFAEQGSHDVSVLNALLQLKLRVVLEHHPTQMVVQAGEFGYGPEGVAEILGFEVANSIEAARADTDALIAEVGGQLDIDRQINELKLIREDTDAGRLAGPEVRARYETVIDGLDETIRTQLSLAERAIAEIRAAPELDQLMDDLVLVYRMVDAVGRQVPLVFDSYLGAIIGGPGSSTAELAMLDGWYDNVSADLPDALTGEPLVVWNTLITDPEIIDFESFINTTISESGSELDSAGLRRLGVMANHGVARTSAHLRLFKATTEQVTSYVDNVREQAWSDFRRSAVFIALFLAATMLTLFLVARSVLLPLRRLARVAVKVSKGDLPAATAVWVRGPQELRVVGGALNDLVAGLRVFDNQALALAEGRLDDPFLKMELPGRLAESLHETVQHLSQSMTEREELHSRLVHEATHDNLTGIPNRAAAMFALENLVIRRAGHDRFGVLLFIDLDGFKRANDAHGHHVGDAVLIETARRLNGMSEADGFVARLGGDEFLVLAHVGSVGEAISLGESIIHAVSEPIDVRGRIVRVGASVGICPSMGEELSSTELLRRADLAVYRAKALGRSRVVVFDEAMRQELVRRVETEEALAVALSNEELYYVLQPVWDLSSQVITGFEALVRWRTADGRQIGPDEFIPVAESSGLIDAIDNYVMIRAAKEIAGWSEFTCNDVHLAVNISGRHLLSRTIVEEISSALAASGLEPHRLVVEITETVLVSDMVIACEHLQELRRLGIRIAIDDFGSGYTSLGHLRLLPVDILKIDRAFVSGLGTDSDDNLVRVLIEAARGLGISVVAEGVETVSQLQVLRGMTCDAVQGHLLGRALMPSDARDQLRLNRSEHSSQALGSTTFATKPVRRRR